MVIILLLWDHILDLVVTPDTDTLCAGGEPCPYDRVLSTRIGAGAAQAIMDGEYGIMIGVVNGKIKRVPLEECAGKLKMVSPKDQLVVAAKQIGISFGD